MEEVLRKRVAVLVAAAMMVMSASPALAAPPAGSTGACRAFGQQISTYAHLQHQMGEKGSWISVRVGSPSGGRMSLFIHFDKEVYRAACGVVL
jgi:hypothetical protein